MEGGDTGSSDGSEDDDGLSGWLADIAESLGVLAQSIIDGLIEGLKYLFVPEEDCFQPLLDKVNSKFGFINQIIELGGNLLNFDYESDPPDVTVELWGVKVDFIEFTYYDQYRIYIHGIIAGFIWVKYVEKLFKTKVPKIVGGAG